MIKSGSILKQSEAREIKKTKKKKKKVKQNTVTLICIMTELILSIVALYAQ